MSNIIVSERSELRKSFSECENDDDWLPILQDEWDDHFHRYKELFVTYCRRAPYHTKKSYRGGFVAKTRRRHDGSSYNPPLYDELADRLVTKHLDPYRYRQVYNDGLWKREESWLGLRIGKRSKVTLIDLDNKHNVIGIYDGLFCDRPRPIVNYALADFQRLKRVYDAYPRHKWCISSATMGLHVWEILPTPRSAEDIERLTRPRLKALGLGQCEVYPSPQLKEQCIRRPFGKDYYTLTGDGPLGDWMSQLDYFESDEYPAFADLVDGIIYRLHIEWAAYDKSGGLLVEANQDSPYVYEDLVNTQKLRRDILNVVRWKEQGFPEVPYSTVPLLCLKSVIKDGQSSRPSAGKAPWDIDLKDVNSGRWVESCVEWATHGLPDDDTLLPVVGNLARWFYYVELVDIAQPQRLERVVELMQTFVLNKHNGYVSSLNLGMTTDVMNRVARIVKRSIAKATEKDLFLRLVQKRRNGQYRTVYYLEPLVAAGNTERALLPLLCLKSVIKEIDDTPLPATVQHRLEEIALANKMRKRNSEYPFLKFARRFLNAIWQGKGKSHINIETINAFMGRKPDYKDFHQQLGYKRLLADHGLIRNDWERFVKRYERSALYRITKETLDSFAADRQQSAAAG